MRQQVVVSHGMFYKHVAVLLIIGISHLFLSSGWLIGIFCVLGAAIGRWGNRRLLVTVVVAELLTGIGFWIFDWNGGQLQALSGNTAIGPLTIAGVAIGVNLVTALLVTAAAYGIVYAIRTRLQAKATMTALSGSPRVGGEAYR